MARRIGDDELATRRREVAVGNVDRDPLLALGAEAIGQEGEIETVAAASAGRVLQGDELVVEDSLRVVQQSTDERALAIVYRAGRREAQESRRGGRPVCGSEGGHD